MDSTNQKNAIDSLRDWSKWLIGLDFVAAGGCVVVLQGGVSGPAHVFLVLAIGAFALSILCSAYLVRVLASAVEALPIVDADGRPKSINDHRAARGISIGALAGAQLLLLMLGAIFFLAWVVV